MMTGPSKIVEKIKVPIQKNTANVSHLRFKGTNNGANSMPKIFIFLQTRMMMSLNKR